MSYQIRFQGHEEEIRHDLHTMGLSPSCDKWKGSLEAWERFAKLLLPGENIPYVTDAYSTPLPKLERDFIHLFCEYFTEMEAKYKQVLEENNQLKMAAQRETEEVKMKFAQMVSDMKESRKRLAAQPCNDNKLRQIAAACRG